jgi:hypothetical protein
MDVALQVVERRQDHRLPPVGLAEGEGQDQHPPVPDDLAPQDAMVQLDKAQDVRMPAPRPQLPVQPEDLVPRGALSPSRPYIAPSPQLRLRLLHVALSLPPVQLLQPDPNQ